jgi:hypothetical protein
MARGRGVVAVGLACALVGCASILSIDGSYEVGDGGAAESSSGADSPATGDGYAHEAGSSSGSAGSSSSGSSGNAGSSGVSTSSSGSSSGISSSSSSSSSGGPDTGIKCDKQYCAVGMQECCITNQTHQCISQGGMCTGLAMKCDDTDDCLQGEVCCGQENQQMTAYETISCQPTCLGQLQHQFCDPAIVNSCPMGLTCIASTLLPGYYACGP